MMAFIKQNIFKTMHKIAYFTKQFMNETINYNNANISNILKSNIINNQINNININARYYK